MARKKNRTVMTSAPEETVQELMKAGFTEYEAKVYISLLSNHPASAYSISQHSGVPHSRVYDISRRLIKKGYAVSSGANPEVFSPLSPDELIGKIRRDNERHTKDLKKKLEQIDFSSDFDPVWNLHSVDDSIEKVNEILAEAEHKIFIGFWSEEYPLLEKELRAAHERGVKVFMLVYGDLECDFGDIYHHERSSAEKLHSLERSLDCAVDTQVCLSGILGTRGESNTKIVWSRNKGLVNAIEGYITHDFYLIEIRQPFGSRVDELFGPDLSELRRKFMIY